PLHRSRHRVGLADPSRIRRRPTGVDPGPTLLVDVLRAQRHTHAAPFRGRARHADDDPRRHIRVRAPALARRRSPVGHGGTHRLSRSRRLGRVLSAAPRDRAADRADGRPRRLRGRAMGHSGRLRGGRIRTQAGLSARPRIYPRGDHPSGLRSALSRAHKGSQPQVDLGVMEEKVAHLPESPGVYLFRDAKGTVLYVGKAKRLRSRVRSYFNADHADSLKTLHLMRYVVDFDTIVVPTEAHALILEANLIKEYHPRFNIALRDDKSYPYIKVTVQEPFPRVFVTRRLLNDGGRYFGPYTDVGKMRRALNVVKQIFTVRSCRYDMPKEMPERPCLDYYIKRCKAPCILAQSQDEYRAMIDEVLIFLDGNAREVVRRVRARMDAAADALNYEQAAELRDMLVKLEKLEEPTVVMEVEGGDRDVVGFARDGDDASVVTMRIRAGKLLARDHRLLSNIEGETDAAVLSAYLTQSYAVAPER